YPWDRATIKTTELPPIPTEHSPASDTHTTAPIMILLPFVGSPTASWTLRSTRRAKQQQALPPTRTTLPMEFSCNRMAKQWWADTPITARTTTSLLCAFFLTEHSIPHLTPVAKQLLR